MGRQAEADESEVGAYRHIYRHLSRRIYRHLGALALFLAVALALTWPLPLHLSDGLALGTEPGPTVPLVNLWAFWWNADRLAHVYSGYWDAPIFHPDSDTLALTEFLPLPGAIAAPASWASGNPALGYNLFLLLALTTNGWLAYRLLRSGGLHTFAALVGAVFVETLPFVRQEIGVIQMVPLAGIILTLHALLRLCEGPTVQRGLWWGVAFATAYLLCSQYALFLVPLIAIAALPLLWDRLQQRQTWKALAAGALLAAVLLSPVLIAQLGARSEHDMKRSGGTATKHSATLDDYRETAWQQLVPLPGIKQAPKPGHHAFFPGTLKLSLTFWGLSWGLRRPNWRAWTGFWALLGLAGLLLSLGPALGSGAASPYGFLAGTLPGFAQVRSLFRLALFFQLAVAALATTGLHALLLAPGGKEVTNWAQLRRVARKGKKVPGTSGTGEKRQLLKGVSQVPGTFGGGIKGWRMGAVALLGLLACVEMGFTQQRILPLPALDSDFAWLHWIEEETEPDDVLAFLPFPQGRSAGAYAATTHVMYWQMRHGRPMVNGYSSYFPKSFRQLKKALQGFPNADGKSGLDAMAGHEVDYCIVQRSMADSAQLEALPGAHCLVRVFTDDKNRIDIYRLEVRKTTGRTSP